MRRRRRRGCWEGRRRNEDERWTDRWTEYIHTYIPKEEGFKKMKEKQEEDEEDRRRRRTRKGVDR